MSVQSKLDFNSASSWYQGTVCGEDCCDRCDCVGVSGVVGMHSCMWWGQSSLVRTSLRVDENPADVLTVMLRSSSGQR